MLRQLLSSPPPPPSAPMLSATFVGGDDLFGPAFHNHHYPTNTTTVIVENGWGQLEKREYILLTRMQPMHHPDSSSSTCSSSSPPSLAPHPPASADPADFDLNLDHPPPPSLSDHSAPSPHHWPPPFHFATETIDQKVPIVDQLLPDSRSDECATPSTCSLTNGPQAANGDPPPPLSPQNQNTRPRAAPARRSRPSNGSVRRKAPSKLKGSCPNPNDERAMTMTPSSVDTSTPTNGGESRNRSRNNHRNNTLGIPRVCPCCNRFTSHHKGTIMRHIKQCERPKNENEPKRRSARSSMGSVDPSDPYQCRWCEFNTLYKGNVKRHLITCHQVPLEVLNEVNFDVERLRKMSAQRPTLEELPVQPRRDGGVSILEAPEGEENDEDGEEEEERMIDEEEQE